MYNLRIHCARDAARVFYKIIIIVYNTYRYIHAPAKLRRHFNCTKLIKFKARAINCQYLFRNHANYIRYANWRVDFVLHKCQ